MRVNEIVGLRVHAFTEVCSCVHAFREIWLFVHAFREVDLRFHAFREVGMHHSSEWRWVAIFAGARQVGSRLTSGLGVSSNR